MKLYYTPGVCSLAPHIVARELGLDFTPMRVDSGKKIVVENGADYWAINPKGYVPALELDNGEVLTEGTAILQYLADLKPEAKLAPPNGSFERYRLLEMLGYLNSELHKTYSPLFNPQTLPETRTERLAYLTKRYRLVERWLTDKPFLLGDQFTVADAYLFAITNWAKGVKLDLSEFPHVLAFQARVAERPAVQAAMAAERVRLNAPKG